METIHFQFDELTKQMAPVQSSPGPAPNLLTPRPISSGLVPNPAPAIPYVPPTNKELEMLFQPMFDEYFNPPGNRQDPIPNAVQNPVILTGPSVSISVDLDAPSGSHTSSPLDHHSSSVHQGVAAKQSAEVNPFAATDQEPFVNVFAPDTNSEASSSGDITIPEINQSTQPHEHIWKWTDSHPLDNIIPLPRPRQPLRPPPPNSPHPTLGGRQRKESEQSLEESTKKQKMDEDKDTIELQSLMEVIPYEEEVAIDVVTLAIKSPSIVGWKIHKKGKKIYYQIMRADGKS
ncbi:hypothetical protein Tco_1029944 [Tanacetum coccineum]|uniref:Uncharacterized protein n=1 Tax=Tanacetum coccineum TaxID=301880 RepID=A0ABQ5G6E4_9ASTR